MSNWTWLETCRHCPSRDACSVHGCRAFNDEARAKIAAEEREVDRIRRALQKGGEP